ncbi:MAG TPA: threonine synthase, partial [Alphaproteobacteria bacterium]|nr:threonine synthase [Alphaproteobacteria bacterium]
GMLIDPHSAVGRAAARRQIQPDRETPMVTLATAHPGKFPDAVQEATGQTPALPERYADLREREERYEILPNDLQAVESFIKARI